ncbi:MAG: RNA polymerase sigma factor [Candidatus Aminicenantales bacterium]
MEEQALIDGLARGDLTAFREFVERYKKRIYYLALDMVGNPVDAEDVSQDVFLKVYRSFGTFKRDAKISSWLYRVTYNACIDHLRKKELTPEAVGDEALEARTKSDAPLSGSPSFPDPHRSLETGQLQARIAKALENVSPQEKAVFLLRHYDQLMLKEIAEILHLSVGSVKSYLFRAVRKLQKELGASGMAPGMEVSHDELP